MRRQTLSGAGWIGGGHVAQIVIRIGVMMVLARLIAPADFGVVALASTLLALCQTVAPLGTVAALLRLREAGEPETKAAFTISMIAATLLAAVAVAAAYAAQGLVEMPRLGLAMLCLSPAIHIDALGRIASRTLQRRMSFRPEMTANLLGYLVGYACIGIPLGLREAGWVALCVAEVASAAVCGAWLIRAARPALGLNFEAPVWRKLIGFGVPFTVSNVIHWGSSHAARLVIGGIAGATALGLYARASDLAMRLSRLADKLCSTVLFAAFCRSNDDRPRLARALSASVSLALLLTLPAAALMSVLAEPLIVLLFGEQWVAAAGTFAVLSFLMPWLLVQRIALVMSHSLGLAGISVTVNSLAFVLSLGGAAVGIRVGLEGVAAAMVTAYAVSSIVAFRMVAAEVGLPLSTLFGPVTKGGGLAAAVYFLGAAFETALIRHYEQLNALQHVGILTFCFAAALLSVWLLGGRWLFSDPARALVDDALHKIARGIGRRFGAVSVAD